MTMTGNRKKGLCNCNPLCCIVLPQTRLTAKKLHEEGHSFTKMPTNANVKKKDSDSLMILL